MRAPDPDLGDIGLADPPNANAGVLPAVRRVRSVYDLPLAGLVGARRRRDEQSKTDDKSATKLPENIVSALEKARDDKTLIGGGKHVGHLRRDDFTTLRDWCRAMRLGSDGRRRGSCRYGCAGMSRGILGGFRARWISPRKRASSYPRKKMKKSLRRSGVIL